jgi:hypothetical protein
MRRPVLSSISFMPRTWEVTAWTRCFFNQRVVVSAEVGLRSGSRQAGTSGGADLTGKIAAELSCAQAVSGSGSPGHSLITASGFEAWINHTGSPLLADTSADADPNADGLSNLIEYVLGSLVDSGSQHAEFAPGKVVIDGESYLTLTFQLRLPLTWCCLWRPVIRWWCLGSLLIPCGRKIRRGFESVCQVLDGKLPR